MPDPPVGAGGAGAGWVSGSARAWRRSRAAGSREAGRSGGAGPSFGEQAEQGRLRVALQQPFRFRAGLGRRWVEVECGGDRVVQVAARQGPGLVRGFLDGGEVEGAQHGCAERGEDGGDVRGPGGRAVGHQAADEVGVDLGVGGLGRGQGPGGGRGPL
ncbi:hypothetical protein ACFYPA_29485 [Streptomyces sp. NPDC005775]|uniref:hypothetical protein n=1 Tax=Streptomyces sp. NPDC005775 TaxID=3364729 RepID=UPI0036CBDC09